MIDRFNHTIVTEHFLGPYSNNSGKEIDLGNYNELVEKLESEITENLGSKEEKKIIIKAGLSVLKNKTKIPAGLPLKTEGDINKEIDIFWNNASYRSKTNDDALELIDMKQLKIEVVKCGKKKLKESKEANRASVVEKDQSIENTNRKGLKILFGFVVAFVVVAAITLLIGTGITVCVLKPEIPLAILSMVGLGGLLA